jgi:transcription initiation factor TFIIIB Brf1 subunit/transcription initiation factor TFIIB
MLLFLLLLPLSQSTGKGYQSLSLQTPKTTSQHVSELVEVFSNKLKLSFATAMRSKELALKSLDFLEGKRPQSIAAASLMFVLQGTFLCNTVNNDINNNNTLESLIIKITISAAYKTYVNSTDLLKSPYKQQELAQVAGISANTLRNVYKRIQVSFLWSILCVCFVFLGYRKENLLDFYGSYRTLCMLLYYCVVVVVVIL